MYDSRSFVEFVKMRVTTVCFCVIVFLSCVTVLHTGPDTPEVNNAAVADTTISVSVLFLQVNVGQAVSSLPFLQFWKRTSED